MNESSDELGETVPKIHFLSFLETSIVLQHNVRMKREYKKGKYFTQKCFTPVSKAVWILVRECFIRQIQNTLCKGYHGSDNAEKYLLASPNLENQHIKYLKNSSLDCSN